MQAWVNKAREEKDGPAIAALLGQLVEGCPPPELVALIARNDAASGHLIAIADLIAAIPNHHASLLAAGLIKALLVSLASADDSPAVVETCLSVHRHASSILANLTQHEGPVSAQAVLAVTAAAGLAPLVATLSRGGAAGGAASHCLSSIASASTSHHAPLYEAGILSALPGAVKITAAAADSGPRAAIAHLYLLGDLLGGPVGAETFCATLATGALAAIVPLLSSNKSDGMLAWAACRCLRAITQRDSAFHKALVDALVVPPLLIAARGRSAIEGMRGDAIVTLLNLTSTQAAARAEAAAAGFDEARLAELGRPLLATSMPDLA